MNGRKDIKCTKYSIISRNRDPHTKKEFIGNRYSCKTKLSACGMRDLVNYRQPGRAARALVTYRRPNPVVNQSHSSFSGSSNQQSDNSDLQKAHNIYLYNFIYGFDQTLRYHRYHRLIFRLKRKIMFVFYSFINVIFEYFSINNAWPHVSNHITPTTLLDELSGDAFV